MMAVDTSSLSAFFGGSGGADVELVRSALMAGTIRLPPVVLTEILSDPGPTPDLGEILSAVSLLEIVGGYWMRAGQNRRKLKQRGLKALVTDSLIAQSCIDHGLQLITRDNDFRHFAKHCGLKLA